MGFLDNEGELYDYHISDNLKDGESWNAIDFKFSLSHSKYILIWKRDRSQFTKDEADYVTEYVRHDMKEYMYEGRDSLDKSEDPEGSQTKISKKILSSKKCLILAYDSMELPIWTEDWNDLADDIQQAIQEKIEEPKFSKLEDLALDDIISGRTPTNPYLESYRFRDVKYQKFDLPSDSTLKEVYHKIQNSDFSAAANYLAGAYQISPPNIDLKNTLPDAAFVFYENPDSTIILSLDKIPEFWQQLPAFFLGFFKHLSQSKNWKFGGNYVEDPFIEKKEAEKFSQVMINRLLELGLDPR